MELRGKGSGFRLQAPLKKTSPAHAKPAAELSSADAAQIHNFMLNSTRMGILQQTLLISPLPCERKLMFPRQQKNGESTQYFATDAHPQHSIQVPLIQLPVQCLQTLKATACVTIYWFLPRLCRFTSSKYLPLRSSSSPCVPDSTIRPWSNTYIISAF